LCHVQVVSRLFVSALQVAPTAIIENFDGCVRSGPRESVHKSARAARHEQSTT
jgi:hypothetical protein